MGSGFDYHAWITWIADSDLDCSDLDSKKSISGSGFHESGDKKPGQIRIRHFDRIRMRAFFKNLIRIRQKCLNDLDPAPQQYQQECNLHKQMNDL